MSADRTSGGSSATGTIPDTLTSRRKALHAGGIRLGTPGPPSSNHHHDVHGVLCWRPLGRVGWR